MKLRAMILAAVLAAPLALSAAVEIGKAAPDFKLSGDDGKTHSLADYKGKTVVLEWVNEGCPFVKKHYTDSKNMQALQKKYTGKGVVWLSIASSAEGREGYWAGPTEAAVFRKAKGSMASSILLDSAGTVGQAYGAKTTPHMYIVDKEGKLAYQGAIDSIASARAKDIPKATNWVAQALDELAAGKQVSVPETRSYGCSVKYK
jgi:alkyl hydroperoxide reductase subunit AhpC